MGRMVYAVIDTHSYSHSDLIGIYETVEEAYEAVRAELERTIGGAPDCHGNEVAALEEWKTMRLEPDMSIDVGQYETLSIEQTELGKRFKNW